MNLAEALRSAPLFADLDGAEREALARAMEVHGYPDGHVFTEEGAAGDTFFFVVEGAVRVMQRGAGGERTHLRDLQSGELFGLLALIDHGPRSATCVAAGPVTVASLPGAAFALLYEGSPELELGFQRLIARQLAHDARSLNRALLAAVLSSETAPSDSAPGLSHDLRLSTTD